MGVLWRLSQLIIADYITPHCSFTLRTRFSNLNTKNKKIRLTFWGFQWWFECWLSWRPAPQLAKRFHLKFVSVPGLFDALRAMSVDVRDIVSDPLQLGSQWISSVEASTSISDFSPVCLKFCFGQGRWKVRCLKVRYLSHSYLFSVSKQSFDNLVPKGSWLVVVGR